MASESSFLRLPREVRDIIYRDYVTLEYGYVYNPATNKLKAGGPIHQPNLMAFQYCCKKVAAEMQGLALEHNVVRFYTVCSIETKRKANAWFCLMRDMHSTEAELLHQARGHIPSEVMEQMASKFPHLRPVVETFGVPFSEPMPHLGWRQIVSLPWEALRIEDENSFSEARSVLREFITSSLRAILDTSLPCSLDQTWRSRARRVLSMPHEPWNIPEDEDDIVRHRQLLFRKFRGPRDTGFNYRFSAAAACIRFLRPVPDARIHMRQVVMEEDRPSVPFAECHALGLLPFIRENPRLRLTRRAHIWRNIFQLAGANDPDTACECQTVTHEPKSFTGDEMMPIIARWVVEHLDLPEESFTLIFDGEPATELCGQIFHESVSRDLQWTRARLEAIQRGLVPQDEFKGNDYPYGEYQVYRRFPRAMADIMTGKTSRIRCNFHPGYLGDPEEIIEKLPSILARGPFWDGDSWQVKWHHAWREDKAIWESEGDSFPSTVFYNTVAPLPHWREIAPENGNDLDRRALGNSPGNRKYWEPEDWTLPFAAEPWSDDSDDSDE